MTMTAPPDLRSLAVRLMQQRLRRKQADQVAPVSPDMPLRSYTGQRAMQLQGLGRVETFDPETGQWKKTGVKRRGT